MDVPKQPHKTQESAETTLPPDRQYSKAETGSQARIGPVRLVPLAEATDKPSEDRIVMLSDGIFAIAITLLVLGIQIPQAETHSHDAFVKALIGDFLANTLFYAITFGVFSRCSTKDIPKRSRVHRFGGICKNPRKRPIYTFLS